ncbi:hypothetical protein FIV42_16360 [Persicimonas caeni]|uniref:Phage tail protein n=1 Tax=Persicimonas caeni TaxID=2292766 RepID=A0A4Y6PV73_PERCE|nr:phage tail sheath subtilisin-like domain-containing protein [Persicimonas caeni]QDG52254.1 hypothetical protein FIV42_16360 [Persicimonas caeni]QED33476.1 hypothetical protein FRD00_16355 [Persicimonas caeni]
MPEYLHPGVYIEEQPAPQTINGVSTSTAGFVGATAKGPTSGRPTLVTSFADFKRQYGGHLGESFGSARFLAYAAEGFFNNGGKRLYVKRVVADDAVASQLTFNNGFTTRLAEPISGGDQVVLRSLRGIEVGTTVRFADPQAGVDETATVEGYDHASGRVTLDAPLTETFTVGRCQVSIDGTTSADAGATTLLLRASSEGEWGDEVSVTLSDQDGALVATASDATALEVKVDQAPVAVSLDEGPAQGDDELTTSTANALEEGDVISFDHAGVDERYVVAAVSGKAVTLATKCASDQSATAEVHKLTAAVAGADDPAVTFEAFSSDLEAGDVVRVRTGDGVQTLVVKAVSGADVTFETDDYPLRLPITTDSTLTHAHAGEAGAASLTVSSTVNLYEGAIVEIDDGTHKQYGLVDTIVDRSHLDLADNLGRTVPAGASVRVVEFRLTAAYDGTTEQFGNLSLNEESERFVETIVNGESELITAEVLAFDTANLAASLPRLEEGISQTTLGGGDNGSAPSALDIVGEDNGPGNRSGIHAMAVIDQVSILAAPGFGDQVVHDALLTQCALLKDRFAVLDPPAASDLQQVQQARGNLDSLYGAMYYPWLVQLDARDGAELPVPPSGHVAGIYARVDNERGVHKAPANEVVRGIVDLEVALTDADQDILNPHPTNINVIRDMRARGRGIRVWGARCVTSDNAWKYVPVRRLFIFVEESLEEGLQWAVFEPNGHALWTRVRRTISGFLRTLWRDGALAGRTPEQAFFVRCDETTMSEQDRANGRLIVEVGIAPLRPAEFVIIRIGQKTLDSAE